MIYGVKPVRRRWRREQIAGIKTVGGSGLLPSAVNGYSASVVAKDVAVNVFGERGKVESLLFSGRSRTKYGYIAGKVWTAVLVGAITLSEQAWGGKQPRLTVMITEGDVSRDDMPKERWADLPGDLLGSGRWHHAPGSVPEDPVMEQLHREMAVEAAIYHAGNKIGTGALVRWQKK